MTSIQKVERNVGGAELAVGAEGVNEPPILSLHVDDERLARGGVAAGRMHEHIDVRRRAAGP